MARGSRGSGKSYRSAITGKYISKAAAARHPRTSVAEAQGKSKVSGKVYRSAITGHYVTAATAARHPKNTVAEE